MNLQKVILSLNICSVLGLIAIIQYASNKKALAQGQSLLPIELHEAQMKVSYDGEALTIQGGKADIETEGSGNLSFSKGVQLQAGSTFLYPETLTLNIPKEEITAHALHLKGAHPIFLNKAEISPSHRMTYAKQLKLKGPFPLQMKAIESIQFESVQTRLSALQYMQERNRQSSSQHPSNTTSPPAGSNPKSLSQSSQPTFTLEAEHLESPMGRLNIRFKLKGLRWATPSCRIQSNLGKIQSSDLHLIFYDQVKIDLNGSKKSTDYASLNLKTGLLKFDSTQILLSEHQP